MALATAAAPTGCSSHQAHGIVLATPVRFVPSLIAGAAGVAAAIAVGRLLAAKVGTSARMRRSYSDRRWSRSR
jgi:hypothetical protein